MNNAWVKPKNPFCYLFDVLSPFILGVVSSDLNLEKIVVRHECSQTGCALTTTTSDTWKTILTRLLQIYENKALSALFTNYLAREDVPLYIWFSLLFRCFPRLPISCLCYSLLKRLVIKNCALVDWYNNYLQVKQFWVSRLLTALQSICFNQLRDWPWERAPQHLPKQSDEKTITNPVPRYIRILRALGSLPVSGLNFFFVFYPCTDMPK